MKTAGEFVASVRTLRRPVCVLGELDAKEALARRLAGIGRPDES